MSTIQIVEFPKPSAPKTLKSIEPKCTTFHPTPWKRGWEHETMCEVRDDKLALVCRIEGSRYANKIADLLIDTINAQAKL